MFTSIAYFLFFAVILVIVFSIYRIYALLPNSKFAKAEKLLLRKKYSEAQEILESIFTKHPLAVSKYSETYLRQGHDFYSQGNNKEALAKYNNVIEVKSLLNPKSNADSYLLVRKSAYYGIAKIQFENIADTYTKESLDAYKKNLGFIKAVSIGDSQHVEELVKNHHIKIGNVQYHLGKKEEQNNDIYAAISKYTRAKKSFSELGDDQKHSEVITRIEICKLKINEYPDLNNLVFISKSPSIYQADFFYRYALYQIKEKEIKKAEDVIKEHLDSEDIKVIELIKVCENEKLKLAISDVEGINEKLKKLSTGSTSNEEVFELYSTISSKADRLNEYIPEIKSDLDSLKPSLFNRVITEFNEKKQYGKIIELITKYPRFYESPVMMKNLGSSCINFLKNSDITLENYKLLIALFLTSAYSDNVMLYSLEETQWDDEYTFSLNDSIGSSYELHSQLPDNVNYDEISDSNISIGESQKFLIAQFESLLNEKKIDPDLTNKVHTFYDSEKKSIEGIISIIPNEILFCTPYFAKQYNTADQIIDELGNDYYDYQNEESLDFGINYLFNQRDCRIHEYKEAKKTLSGLINAVSKGELSYFTESLTEGRKALLLKYEELAQGIEDKIVEILKKKVSKSIKDEELLKIIAETIKISPTKEKLKFHYSSYASTLCINKINDEEMSNYRGLQIMHYAYSLTPNDTRVCSNIIALIRMNIFDILSEQTNNAASIYSILDKINNSRSNTFENNAGELIKTRNEILSQLPPDARVAIISGIDLNSHGRRMKKCLDYLSELGGSSTVRDPLAALREKLGIDLDLSF